MSAPTERRSLKRVEPRVGDLFAIDLADGSWGLGHIVAGGGANTWHVLFAKRAATVEALSAALDDMIHEPIGVLVSNDTDIRRGTWPLVGHRAPDYPDMRLPKVSGEGATWWYTPAFLPDFIEAYLGLRFWDEGQATPSMYRDILLPHLPVPTTARYKAAGSPMPSPPSPPKPPPVTDGPALVTLQLVYPGTGLPSIDLLRKRQELERRLEAAGAGEIEGAESGEGVMEIFLHTHDVRYAASLIESIAAELGLAEDLLLETAPLPEGADDS